MLKIPNYGRVLVALSGGADSVALALLALESGAQVMAAHVEHGIRGEASERDMAFVQDFCARQGIELHAVRMNVPEIAQQQGIGLETAARQARYAFLREAKLRVGADVIATAHHMDDQMETVLMHLFRGCGTRGLEGMRERSGDIVRPLLKYSKAELIEYLNRRQQCWCEDETNREAITPRNVLRNRAIPGILSAYPQAGRAVARLARAAQLEGEYLDAQAGRLVKKELCGWSIEKDAPEALVKRALAGFIPDFEGVGEAYQREAVSLPGGWQARTCQGRIYLTAPDAQPFSAVPLGDTTQAGGVHIVREAWPDEPSRDKMAQVFAAAALKGAQLRPRRPGDFIRPFGMQGKKLLSDYMQGRGIPLPLRDFWPLIAVDDEVLWVIGTGVSETSKVRTGSACVRLTAKYIG